MTPKSNSRAVQRQIDLTTAVCQERLLASHVRHSLALVDLVSDSLPFDDALDIYVRILRLNAEQARNIGSRALAELGRRSGLPAVEDLHLDSALEEEEGRDEDSEDPSATGRSGAIFSRVRRRIQGRVQADLRQRINLAAARAEDDLLTAHVDNALLFVKALADEMPPPAAVDLYLETMVLSEGLGDVVYNRALSTIADHLLPPVPQPANVRPKAAQEQGPRHDLRPEPIAEA
ncbi:hypothetical protein BH23GEM3_BH23GEM3_17830 [soil metagenome]